MGPNRDTSSRNIVRPQRWMVWAALAAACLLLAFMMNSRGQDRMRDEAGRAQQRAQDLADTVIFRSVSAADATRPMIGSIYRELLVAVQPGQERHRQHVAPDRQRDQHHQADRDRGDQRGAAARLDDRGADDRQREEEDVGALRAAGDVDQQGGDRQVADDLRPDQPGRVDPAPPSFDVTAWLEPVPGRPLSTTVEDVGEPRCRQGDFSVRALDAAGRDRMDEGGGFPVSFL
jgi:hypothetical protein